MATKTKQAKYTDREVAVRDAARKLAEGKPLSNPIRASQARVYLKAANGTAADPFVEGGALAGMKTADAKKVASGGGRGISTRGIGAWREGKRRSITNSALDNNRVVACLALAAKGQGA